MWQDVFCHVSDLQEGEGSVVEAIFTVAQHGHSSDLFSTADAESDRATPCCTLRNGTTGRLSPCSDVRQFTRGFGLFFSNRFAQGKYRASEVELSAPGELSEISAASKRSPRTPTRESAVGQRAWGAPQEESRRRWA